METTLDSNRTQPKLALTRLEAAAAIGQSPATVDRLTKRGLLSPSRATRRPVYPVWEIERFLRDTAQVIELDAAAVRPSPSKQATPCAGTYNGQQKGGQP